MNHVVAMTMRQPITYQIDSGICRVLTRWYKHRLWHTECRVDVNAFDLLHSEICTDLPDKMGDYHQHHNLDDKTVHVETSYS